MREGRRRPSLGGNHGQRAAGGVARNEGGAPAPLVAMCAPPDITAPSTRNEGGAPAPLVGRNAGSGF